MQNETLKVIRARRSTRSYLGDKISDEELGAILEAGLWAPTARNEQEISVAVVRGGEVMAAFKEDFRKNNQRGARFDNFDYSAPVFLFLYGPRDFPYTEMDSGIVEENMALAAESIGLGSVLIGCIRDFMRSDAAQSWRERFGMTQDDIFTVGVAIGRKAKETAERPRKENRIKFIN